MKESLRPPKALFFYARLPETGWFQDFRVFAAGGSISFGSERNGAAGGKHKKVTGRAQSSSRPAPRGARGGTRPAA